LKRFRELGRWVFDQLWFLPVRRVGWWGGIKARRDGMFDDDPSLARRGKKLSWGFFGKKNPTSGKCSNSFQMQRWLPWVMKVLIQNKNIEKVHGNRATHAIRTSIASIVKRK
jgi:hypothetical protein